MNSKTTLGIALAVSFLGCTSTYTDLCTQIMDCAGGNEADIDACVADAEASEDRAAAYGCDAEWEALFLCQEESFDCNDEQIEFDSDCAKDEGDDYADCVDDGSDIDD